MRMCQPLCWTHDLTRLSRLLHQVVPSKANVQRPQPANGARSPRLSLMNATRKRLWTPGIAPVRQSAQSLCCSQVSCVPRLPVPCECTTGRYELKGADEGWEAVSRRCYKSKRLRSMFSPSKRLHAPLKLPVKEGSRHSRSNVALASRERFLNQGCSQSEERDKNDVARQLGCAQPADK